MRRAQSRRGLCYWQATVVLSPLTQETKQLKMLRGEEEIQQQAAIHGHQKKKNHIVPGSQAMKRGVLVESHILETTKLFSSPVSVMPVHKYPPLSPGKTIVSFPWLSGYLTHVLFLSRSIACS